MTSSAWRPRHARRGFVLPAVVVVVTVMALALWAAISVLEGVRRDLQILNTRVLLERDSATIEARISYLLARHPLGPRGVRINGQRISREEEFGVVRSDPNASPASAEAPLSETLLALDDRSYAIALDGGAPLRIQIQDEAGLANVNSLRPDMAQRLAALAGASEERSRHFGDALLDYIDGDDLRRLNGAEREDYARLGLASPANRNLKDVSELNPIFEWGSLSPAERARILGWSSATLPTIAYNLNTASPAVLHIWFGLAPEEAERVVSAREIAPLIGVTNVVQLTGRPIVADDLRIYTFPSRRFRVTITTSGAEVTTYQTWVTIGAAAADRPFFWAAPIVNTQFTGRARGQGNEALSQFPRIASGAARR